VLAEGSQPARHVCRGAGLPIAFCRFLLLILAMRAYIGRFERLLDDHTDLRAESLLHGMRTSRSPDAHRLRRSNSRRGDRNLSTPRGFHRGGGWSRPSFRAVCYMRFKGIGMVT